MRGDKPWMYDYDLICIGCGAAGEKAATQAAYFRNRVAVVEQSVRPGGAMVNTGTIPSKALRETALLCSAFRRRPLPGIDFMIDRNVSIAQFSARRHLVEQQEHDRIESSLDRHGIDVKHGTARIVDPQTVEITGDEGTVTTASARFIMIATGSSPARPVHIPFDGRRIVDADGVLRLDRLPASMIIVGGGVIGCEYASTFREIDVDVTLVHPQAEVLGFLDRECRDELLASMRRTGIRVELEAAVASAELTGEGVEVELDDGRRIAAELLLWTAGRQGRSAGLGLESLGIAVDERGHIEVDDHYRTSVPSIFATGDVVGFPALAATSMEQGRIAACHMFGIPFKQRLARLVPIGIHTIPPISSVGLNEVQALEAGREPVVGRARYRYNARGRMLGDDTGLLKCVFDRKSRGLLGVTILGEDAIELIHYGQVAIAHECGIDSFIDTCFNYPSLSELYKYAAYDALQSLSGGHVRAETGRPTRQVA